MAVLWTNGVNDFKFFLVLKGIALLIFVWFLIKFIRKYPDMGPLYIGAVALFSLCMLLYFLDAVAEAYNPMIMETEGIRIPVRTLGILSWRTRLIQWSELDRGKLTLKGSARLSYHNHYIDIHLKNGEFLRRDISGDDGDEERRVQFAHIWEKMTKAPIEYNPERQLAFEILPGPR